MTKHVLAVAVATTGLLLLTPANAAQAGETTPPPLWEEAEKLLPPLISIEEICVQNEENLAYPICAAYGESSTVRLLVGTTDYVVDENTPCSIAYPTASGGYTFDLTCGEL